MPTIDAVVASTTPLSVRGRQVSAMFDAPPMKKQSMRWTLEAPLDEREWSLGLIVGPSGSGKTTIARHLWPDKIDRVFSWSDDKSLIDDFSDELGVDTIAKALGSVGLNTIPAWLRPHAVLSNGEKFRAQLARNLAESGESELIVFDEFTSVVDRQVAKIASHAVQKAVRRTSKRFVAVSCHYDIIDWLQPDWIIEPAERRFTWRSVQPRPRIEAEIRRVDYSTWALFAPYHYLTASLNSGAACYALFIDERPVAFTGVLHRPHPTVKDIVGISRTVTLPDWQGLGLSFILNEFLGSLYRAAGFRFHNYPAHPSFIQSHQRSKKWKQEKKGGTWQGAQGVSGRPSYQSLMRPCAIFKYVGPALSDLELSEHLDMLPPTKQAKVSQRRKPGASSLRERLAARKLSSQKSSTGSRASSASKLNSSSTGS